MMLPGEQQWSTYSFDYADVASLWKHLDLYEAECLKLLEKSKELFGEKSTADELTLKRFPVLGAYELALKCSHVFNLLDARGRDQRDGAGWGDGADSGAGDWRGEGVCGAGRSAGERGEGAMILEAFFTLVFEIGWTKFKIRSHR